MALVAGLSVLVSRETGWPVVVAAFASLILFLVVNFFDDVRRGAERGLTSEAAFLVSFLLGALSLIRDVIRPREYKFLAVAGVAVVATALLSAKPALNPLVRRLSRQDVVATLKFLILSVGVLPLLPDRAFGPFDALNPRQIGTLVVLMAGISFLGYAAILHAIHGRHARERRGEHGRQPPGVSLREGLRGRFGIACLREPPAAPYATRSIGQPALGRI